jgi:hypothetical protein
MSSELSEDQAETAAAAIEEASEWNRHGADVEALTRRCDA